MATRVQAPGGAAPQSDTLVSSSVLTRSPLTSDEFEVDRLEGRSQTPSDFSTSAFQENFAGVPVNSGSMPLVQPKLVVGPPNDKYEQEADRVADQVMGMPEPGGLVSPSPAVPAPQTAPGLQRQLVESESLPDLDDDEELVQTKALGPPPSISQILGADHQLQREPLDDLDDDDKLVQMKAAGAATAIASPTLATQLGQGGGHPLPSSTRHFMETRFDHDFGGVRVHSDNQSAQLNRGLNAQAFTHGHHVYFGQGQYQPQTHSGQKLLAHELTHTIQQGAIPRAKRLKTPSANLQAKHSGQALPVLETSTQPLISRRVEPSLADAALTTVDPVIIPESEVGTSLDGAAIASPDAPKTDSLEASTTMVEELEELEAPVDDSDLELDAEEAIDDNRAERSPTSPEEDPAFQAVVARAETVADQQQQHEPAATASNRAQAAAVPPANDVESQAQDRQVQEMDQQQPGTFDAKAFIEALLVKIDEIAPKDEDEAADFKKNNKVDSVKRDVSSQVGDEKQQAADPIASRVGETLNTSGLEPKPFTPLEPQDAGPVPPDLHADQAAPKPKTDIEVAQPLEQNSQELDQQMESVGVSEEVLASSGEPEFVGAVAATHEAQADAATAPDGYRQDEAGILAAAQAQAEGTSEAQTGAMHDERGQLLAQVMGAQEQTQSQDEEKRAQVTHDIDQIYEQTQTDVETLLNNLDEAVDQQFDAGAEVAKQDFENYVDRAMKAYKRQRYGAWHDMRGYGRRIGDFFTGLPPEVNKIYVAGRNRYLGLMRQTLSGIATHVADTLNQAKLRIAQGKQQIQEYVAGLDPALQEVGQAAADEIQARFDDLEAQVNSKQDELVDSLAQRYQENLQEVDARIEEMQAANRGLIDHAMDLVNGVIETIRQLREMLENVLARVREVAALIIQDPIGFFKNLAASLKQGFDNFVDNITTHLQTGLIGWLTGALGPMGLEIPEDIFSLEGIFSLVLQVLGITWNFIRTKAVRLFGEPVVAAMEQGVEIFQILMRDGPVGLWEYIKEQFSNLKEMVMDQIEDMVITQVIQAGMRWLLSLLNPVAAFVKAAIAIYDVVMFFVNKASQIGEFIMSVIDSVAAIAQGNLSGAAQMIENALVRSLPLIIGFLASLLGITGLAQRVQAFIERLRQRIETAIDKLLKWLGKQARRLLRSLGLGDEEGVGVDPADHTAMARQAANEIKQVEGEPQDHETLRSQKEQQARQVEQRYTDLLEAGIRLSVSFQNRTSNQTDNDIDFEVIIAPNTTRLSDTIIPVGNTTNTGIYLYYKYEATGTNAPHIVVRTVALIEGENKELSTHLRLLTKSPQESSQLDDLIKKYRTASPSEYREAFARLHQSLNFRTKIEQTAAREFQSFIPLSDENSRRAYEEQIRLLSSGQPQYASTNTCASHAIAVLQAGGIPVPSHVLHLEENLAAYIREYLEEKLQSLPQWMKDEINTYTSMGEAPPDWLIQQVREELIKL